jgi:hypothetical protein
VSRSAFTSGLALLLPIVGHASVAAGQGGPSSTSSVVPNAAVGSAVGRPPSEDVATILGKRSSPVPGTVLVEQGTRIRLMVTREVSSRTAKAGDRFALRVDEDLVVDGVSVVPTGATAWGEVQSVKASSAAGVSGKLSANLLYVDLPAGHLPITGDHAEKGASGGAGLGLAIYAWGPLGLLLKGHDGRLRAGDIFNAYVAHDLAYDPTVRSLTEVVASPPLAASLSK